MEEAYSWPEWDHRIEGRCIVALYVVQYILLELRMESEPQGSADFPRPAQRELDFRL